MKKIWILWFLIIKLIYNIQCYQLIEQRKSKCIYMQDREPARRYIVGPPASTGCVVSVQIVQTSWRHRCTGASTNLRKRQRRKFQMSNPAPGKESHTVFSVCNTYASPLWLAIRLLTSGDVEKDPEPQGTWNKTQSHRINDSWLVWYDTLSVTASQASVRWSDGADFSCSYEVMVQLCGSDWPPPTRRELLEAERCQA